MYNYVLKVSEKPNEYELGLGLQGLYNINENDLEYKKEVVQFFIDEGYKFYDDDNVLTPSFLLNGFPEEINLMLIEHDMKLTKLTNYSYFNNLAQLAVANQTKALKAALKKGYKPTWETLHYVMTCSNADMVQFLLDNGAEMPDNILEEAVDASKATVKVLIDNGANTDLKFDVLQPTDGGGRRLEGDFDLKDYFKHWGREDLVDLLE